jgi:RNA polymerase sigma factor (sigma-70 family)
MGAATLSRFVGQLRGVVVRKGADRVTDTQLLERFVGACDEVAFEALLWRHASLVLGVCRRILRNEQDAEDAFQATFLVLVQKAASIDKRESVAGWLYKVAYRVALRARLQAAKRQAREKQFAEQQSRADTVPTFESAEMWEMLDEEVNRLPEKFRTPFILCQLEGKTTFEAAHLMSCPPGTVGTRLSRARELLRARLARRGLTLSAGLMSAALAENLSSAVPAAVVDSTVRGAMLIGAGKTMMAGTISMQVWALARGVLQAMFFSKLKMAAAVLLVVALASGGVSVLTYQTWAVEPAGSCSQVSVSKTKEEGVDLRWKFEKGKLFYQEMATETKQAMLIDGQNVNQEQKQTFYFSWSPKEQDKDKNWIISQKIQGVKSNIDLNGNKVEYDSTKPALAAGNPLADCFKDLVGSEFKLTISPEMRVIKVDGHKELIQKLIKGNPGNEATLKGILSEDALKQMSEPAFGASPSKLVKKGDTWEKKITLDLGPLGTYDTTNKYRYEGQVGALDKIKVETILAYRQPGAGAGPFPFQIKEAKLTTKSGDGTIWFDRDKHRLERSELKLILEGKLSIVIGGNASTVDLKQEQTTTVKTTDTNPIQR